MADKQDLQGKKILIVEDESHIAEGVAFNLRKEGFEVKIAVNGVEAIDFWQSYKPDLLILVLSLTALVFWSR